MQRNPIALVLLFPILLSSCQKANQYSDDAKYLIDRNGDLLYGKKIDADSESYLSMGFDLYDPDYLINALENDETKAVLLTSIGCFACYKFRSTFSSYISKRSFMFDIIEKDTEAEDQSENNKRDAVINAIKAYYEVPIDRFDFYYTPSIYVLGKDSFEEISIGNTSMSDLESKAKSLIGYNDIYRFNDYSCLKNAISKKGNALTVVFDSSNESSSDFYHSNIHKKAQKAKGDAPTFVIDYSTLDDEDKGEILKDYSLTDFSSFLIIEEVSYQFDDSGLEIINSYYA